MSVSGDAKQRKPWFDQPNPPHRPLLAPRMFKVLSFIRRFTVPEARRILGLSDFEWRVMSQVGDRAPMSLNELAALSAHDKGQLSRGVKRLVEAGLLVRESRRGERGVFISPTAEGRKTFEELVKLAFTQSDALLAGITDEELATFQGVLGKMEANAAALMASAPHICEAEAEPAPPRRAKAAVRA